MLFSVAFTWHDHTTIDLVRQRHDQQFKADALPFEKMRGWYEFAGGGAGFLLVEVSEPQELTDLFQPYLDLMRIDVRAVHAVNVADVQSRIEQRVRQTG